ncbi:MAG: MFS transporter [Rhodobacteraceae bacterium]|nr:MFS transporter [Paracoccaceae bacterium]
MSKLPHHKMVFLSFYLYSVMLGAIFPRLGELQSKMGLGESALGLGLLGFALGTQITLMFGAPLIERLGHRNVLLLCIPLLGFAEMLATLMPGVLLFFSMLILAGLAIGTLEIVINLEADRAEHNLGRRIMNRAHAFWSFGFFTTGLIGAIAAQMNVSPGLHLALLLVLVTTLVWFMLSGFEPAAARNFDKTDAKSPLFVRPSLGILALVAFTLSAMLLEGAGADWSVIYMRDIFDEPAFVNGMAFTFGALTQAIARYFADTIIDRHGPYRVARVLVAILGLGAIIVFVSPNAYLSLLGFGLMGVGTSAIFPLAMSAAAQRTDRPAATNVAALAQLSFIVFLIAPPLLGYIAEHIGIRYSFGLALPLVLVSWVASRAIIKTEAKS